MIAEEPTDVRASAQGVNFASRANVPLEPTPDLGGLVMHTEGETLHIAGDVDLYEAPRFRLVAEEHILKSESPRFDMSGVAFLDSAGLATLLYLSRKAAGSQKTLCIKIAGGPRRVLRITGIDRMLDVED